MKTVGQIIRQRREALGFTLAALATEVGATKSYLSMIENHKTDKPPSTQLLAALEQALDIRGQLLQRAADWQNTPPGVRAQLEQYVSQARQARTLAREVKKLTNLDQAYHSGELAGMIDSLLDRQEGDIIELQETATRRVPLINKVAAGYPTDFTDLDYPAASADDYITCPDVADDDAFAARVVGESMSPDYREGDVVVFSPAADVKSGDDCFVRIEPDHETTFKRIFFEDDDIRLQPLNPQFPPTVFKREQVVGLYKAVWKLQRIGQ